MMLRERRVHAAGSRLTARPRIAGARSVPQRSGDGRQGRRPTFGRACRSAVVYVYDNGSSDGPAHVARAAGAIVRTRSAPGKGRRDSPDAGRDRRRHLRHRRRRRNLRCGERAATWSTSLSPTTSTWSPPCARAGRRRRVPARPSPRATGPSTRCSACCSARDPATCSPGTARCRVASRSRFPPHRARFEIETELTVHALEQRLPTGEVRTPLLRAARGLAEQAFDVSRRPAHPADDRDAVSRRKAAGVLRCVRGAARRDRAWLLGGSVVIEFMETRLVPRFPTAILATGLMLLAFLALGCGLILHNVARGQRELKRLAYLAASASVASAAAVTIPPGVTSAGRQPAAIDTAR